MLYCRVDRPLPVCSMMFCTSPADRARRTTIHRPVQVPLGALVKFSLALLTCKKEERTDEHVDISARSMESVVTPQIWALACDLVSSLANG